VAFGAGETAGFEAAIEMDVAEEAPAGSWAGAVHISACAGCTRRWLPSTGGPAGRHADDVGGGRYGAGEGKRQVSSASRARSRPARTACPTLTSNWRDTARRLRRSCQMQTDEREHRHAEEDAGDAADLAAGEDAEDDEQGMQLDAAAHQVAVRARSPERDGSTARKDDEPLCM
jgi:hypothetical protein